MHVLKKFIAKNAYIESATIKRILPNKIETTVDEREKKFSLEFLNGYAYINSQGYVLEISSDKLNLPVIQGASTPEEKIYTQMSDFLLKEISVSERLN